ncbi:hypothetical protein BGZ76_002920 [Entomortierella beljakovae]|nr:hypothetical protein BGZ76_002920 [Entomortierella beljakovae]
MASTLIPNVELHDRWHSGERKVQDLMHVRELVQNHSSMFRPFLTTQMQEFVPGLNYFFIGTLDEQGRPWVSILTGQKGFLQSSDIKSLEIKTNLNEFLGAPSTATSQPHVPHDPIFSNLLNGETFKNGKRMWGGVGLDFTNRRRNKMNGVLYPNDLLEANGKTGELHLQLTVEQSIGNCPKYITIREMVPPKTRGLGDTTDVGTSNNSTSPSKTKLGDEEAAIIHQADCLFISSRFIDEELADQTSGMDCNHRGGNPGFVKLRNGNSSLVFPDYSGNRFFNTLGNIANDERVGLLFISFEDGDLLHVTGRAKIHVGAESQAIYPHTQRCVEVIIDGHILRKDALPFRMRTKELSPYNPTVPSNQQRTIKELPTGRASATLSRITKHTDDISTFHFKTSRPINYLPGQYAVLDFSQFDTVGYRHMAPDNPLSLNDDYIRTWTISSSPTLDSSTSNDNNRWLETSEFEMTIKRKIGGAVSNLLHSISLDNLRQPFTVPLVSTGGNFTLPQTESNSDKQNPTKFALISGGIGSTPFISMIRGAKQPGNGSAVDIKWINSVPFFEDSLPDILNEFSGTSSSPKKNHSLDLSVEVFLSRDEQSSISPEEFERLQDIRFHFERLNGQGLLASTPDLHERQILLCGPDAFMEAVNGYLQELGIPGGRIQTEDFNF